MEVFGIMMYEFGERERQGYGVVGSIGHTGEVCGLRWRSDGELLASVGNDNVVNIWDGRLGDVGERGRGSAKWTKRSYSAAVKVKYFITLILSLFLFTYEIVHTGDLLGARGSPLYPLLVEEPMTQLLQCLE